MKNCSFDRVWPIFLNRSMVKDAILTRPCDAAVLMWSTETATPRMILKTICYPAKDVKTPPLCEFPLTLQGGVHRSRIRSIIRSPAPATIEAPIGQTWRFTSVEVRKRYLSDVRRSTFGSQKSEARRSVMEKNDFREGLRGRSLISVLLHFSEPFENTKGNQKLSWYNSCKELFDPESGL
jgi:hypothetical protein